MLFYWINRHQNVVLYVMGIFPQSDEYIPFGERQQNGQNIVEEGWDKKNQYFYSVQFMNEYLKSYADPHRTNNSQFADCNHGVEDCINLK